VGTTQPITLATLMNYDAVFLAANAADNQVLIDYVRAGGSVYLCAGTGFQNPAQEAVQWNAFLREFGLEYAEAGYNGISGFLPVGFTHYVFRGVDELFFNNGNTINKLDPYDPQSRVVHEFQGSGTVAAFDPVGNPLVLHGTAIDDGRPVGGTLTFLWEKADGPGEVHFGSSSSPVSTVVFSAAGTYVLRLIASDGELSGTNEVTVTVDDNEPSFVSAGPDQTITLPAQVLLQGSVTNDAFPVGSVVTVAWSRLLGPGEVVFANSNALTTTASFSVPGSYTLQLAASDSDSSASDIIRIVVNNPCVTNLNGLAAWWPLDGTLSDFFGGNAGVPFVSAMFTNGNVGQGLRFDGSADGVFIPASPGLDVGAGGGLTIETWVKPASVYSSYPFVTWANTNGSGETGVQLAMDSGGALIALLTDTNGSPHVVAVPGPLHPGDGRLLRGGIFQHVAITYDRFSGAAALYLGGQAIVQTNLGSFVPQTGFDLWLGTMPGGAALEGVLDEVAIHRRALAAEEIRAVVEANNNGRCKELQVNAGLDLALVLPEARTLTGLVGGGPVLTGGVYQVTWSLVSGPTNGSVEFSATNALSTTATFSAPGEYLLSLEATAGAATASDQVRVTVHPTGTVNQPPFVQAGTDQTNLIAHTFALSGSFTDDGLPGLVPTTARWRVFDGPTTDALFGDVSAPVTTVRFYMGGTYVLRLTAYDGTYAGSDDVTIRVIQNFAPSVSTDSTVTTSNYLAVLRGNVTDDGLPGTGVTQQWSQVTGPGTVTFATPTAQQTVASFPALGQYRLQFTATDGELTSSVEVIVNVVTPANQAPVVNAGSDRTVAAGLPVRLEGTVRDDGQPTGNVTTTWTQLPGSGTASFTTVNGEWHVTLSGPGTFQLRLTASDGSLSASDDVVLTAVSPTGAPSVQITAPTNNALFTAGDTLTLSASVTTPGTTARQVEFFLGDQSQGVVTNSPFDLPWVALVGTNSLTALVTDNLGQTALSLAVLVRVQASPTNQPPLARADSTAVDRNTVDNLIVVLANDVDPDGDALAVATVSSPANGTAGVAPGSSIVRYTPLAGFVGTDSFSYTVSDGFGGYATGAVTVVVGTTNRPPLAVADALRVEPDSTGTVLSVLANDHDPDHDFFSLTNVSNATTGTVALYFTAGATQAYAVSYTPPVGYRGPAQFSYTVTDMHGASATGMVTVTVLEPNRIPSAVPDTFTVESDSLTNLLAVLANDTDPDADALVITAYQQPLHGSLFIVPGHTTLHYQPDPGWSGPDDFQYQVSDGRGGLAIGAVTITVRPPNITPIALDDTLAVRTDSTNNVLLVLNNDTDPDGDPLVILTNTVPEFGTVSLAPGGTNLLYTALPGSTNTDTFTYTISDGRGGEATATVTVTVGGNTTPLARNDTASALVNSTDNVIPVLVNDADPDGDALILSAVVSPTAASGTATISGTNVLYTPPTAFTGTDSFSYTISDGNGGESSATVTVTVYATNIPPVAVADAAFVLTNSGPNVIRVLTNDTDANFDPLFVSAITQPAHGSVVNQSTLVTYTPATGYLGNDSFTYVVGDGRGGYATGAVSVVVIESNRVPVAQDDLFRVFANGTTTSLRVLVNDTDADGHALTIVSTDTPTQGSVTILPGGTNLAYTAPVDVTGWDAFTYTISDGRGGTATATVYVQLQVLLPPSIELTSPADGASYVGGATVPVTAAVFAPNTTVTRVEFFLDGVPWRVFTNAPYTFNWTAIAGTHELTAKVTDNLGQIAESDPVTITVSVPAGDINPPVAIITNLPPHVSQVDGLTVTNEIAVVRDGLFALRGTADDADAGDAVSYRILLYLADGTFIADVTPGTVDADGFHAGRVSDDVLGTNNFTGLQNDIYELELVVRGGFQEARTRQRFALDSNLKVGQFSFTQQDMVIPVSGFPLTVLRTYNTLNPAAGDFGYSWTWSINDLDIVLDETRADVMDIDDEVFSQRDGGGRDITLTLPDGRRTTFLFSLQPSNNPEEPWLRARWTAPPGVHATLVPTVDNRLMTIFQLVYWQAAGQDTPIEAFDFPGFILTTQDGTQYHLDRPNLGAHFVLDEFGNDSFVQAYGKPFLKRIVQRNGNSIEISSDRVQHFDAVGQPTRALVFERNGEGRISAIYDPNNQDTNGVPTGPPAVRYGYDARGNLTQVHKLVSFNATATNELTTAYVYDHAVFPHYLTRIIDPRGYTPLRSLYDDNGLLIGTVDASGRTNRFVHDVNNRLETLYDRLNNPTYHRYDARGNVVETINALGKSTLRTYDDLDNLLTETDPLGNVTTYSYDGQGNRLSVTLPYPPGADTNRYTTRFTYDSFGNQTSVTSPTGAAQISEFDPLTGNLLSLKDESNNVLVAWTYDANGNQTSETDVFGTTSFGFDGVGNANRMTNSLGQVIQSTYTLNGDIATLTENGVTSTFLYDSAGRETFADYGNGITVSYGNETFNTWTSVSGPTLGTMARSVDEQGRLAGWSMANGGTPGFAYDAEGRLEYETNAVGRVKRNFYDLVGRVSYVQDVTTGAGTAFGYDDAGRRISVTNTFSQVSRTAYNPDGSVAFTTNALGRVWQYLYDLPAGCCGGMAYGGQVIDPLNRTNTTVTSPHGLLLESIHPDGAKVTFTYLLPDSAEEGDQYPATITDEGNHVRGFGYNNFGQLTNATDLGSNAFTYVYQTGRLASIVGPDSQQLYGYTYDALDNRQTITYSDGGVATMGYGTNNKPSSILLPSTVGLALEYDHAQRLTNRTSTLGEFARFSYNANDTVTAMTDNTGTTQFTPDAAGRTAEIVQPTGARVTYSYDLADRVTNVTVRASATGTAYSTRYEYDAVGNLWRVTDPLNGVTVLLYDAANQLTNRTLPNGIVTTFSYNLRGQLTNLVHMKNGTVLAGAAYERQGVGEPSRITREDGSYVDLGYDHAHRLTNETHRAAGGALVEQISYGYDVAGNRTSHVTAAGSHAYSYLGGHRLSTVTGPANQSFSWDTGGRISSITRDSETLTLGYNSDDRLTSVSDGTATLTYTYDGQGRRVRAASGASERRFVVAPMANSDLESPHLVTDGANAVLGGFAYVGGQPLMRYDANGAATYYLEDAMGSVIALADGTGTPTALFAYDAFGNVRAAAGATNGIAGVGGDYRFHGHWFEEATGLYHARARDYDARTGRFIERDPVEGDHQRPETFHPYAFANSNPQYYTDPTGLFSLGELFTASGTERILNASKSQSVNTARKKILEKLGNAITDKLGEQLRNLIPVGDLNFLFQGLNFERTVRRAFCATLGEDTDSLHWEPSVKREGRPLNDGYTCRDLQDGVPGGALQIVPGAKRPDFVIGARPYANRSYPRTWVIGDVKRTTGTIYNAYVRGGNGSNPGQFDAIVNYARDHTYSRVAVFIAITNGSGTNAQNVKQQVISRAIRKGSYAKVITLFSAGRR
jgi:RHS repeat-associated protein